MWLSWCSITWLTWYRSTADHQKTLIFQHINTRLINNLKNFDALYEFLSTLSYPPDVIYISESRLKGDPLINILLPNYNLTHAVSPTNAGGVAIYILSKYKYEIDHDLKMNTVGYEDLWLNIFPDNKSLEKITIGAIYRHPNLSNNNMRNFIDSLANSIKKINDRKGKFYVLGDLNIDISLNKRTANS